MVERLRQAIIERPRSALREFVGTESSGGLVLMAAAAMAIAVANSGASAEYFGALKTHVLGLSLLHWVNDGLMAVFFLLVGLEVKREVLDGQLSTWERRILPGAAAVGGMLAPALIFVSVNWGNAETIRGWAIPSATDIAFALGVLALLGPRVPASLKVFLTALAILDDLGAIAIIALFYSGGLNLLALAGAGLLIGVLAWLNRRNVTALSPYLVIGAVIWFLTLKSGVHATLAGVAVAMTIPLKAAPARPDDVLSPLHRLEHAIAPWVAFLVVPIFGFANAGLSFAEVEPETLSSPIVLGIAGGLFLGKQVGVFGIIWLLERLGVADYPANASRVQVYGMSLLCGIGFTMSLFIGGLAYRSVMFLDEVKLGVLAGSLLSGIAGAAVLALARPEPSPGT